MKPEDLEQQSAQYRKQADTMLANYHRLIGAALALEEMAAKLRGAPTAEQTNAHA